MRDVSFQIGHKEALLKEFWPKQTLCALGRGEESVSHVAAAAGDQPIVPLSCTSVWYVSPWKANSDTLPLKFPTVNV